MIGYIVGGVAAVVIVVVVIVFAMQNKGGDKKGKGSDKSSGSSSGGDLQYRDRIIQLLRIVLDQHAKERHESTTREIVRLGNQINESGGFRRMVSVQSEVQKKAGDRAGGKLSAIWKGIGEWTGSVR